MEQKAYHICLCLVRYVVSNEMTPPGRVKRISKLEIRESNKQQKNVDWQTKKTKNIIKKKKKTMNARVTRSWRNEVIYITEGTKYM